MPSPLFLLRTVLFPQGRLPLRVFERRYLDMVRACLRDDSGFVIALIADGPEAGGPAVPHTIGVEVRVVDWNAQPDGLLGLVVQGLRRVRIVEWWSREDGLVMGRVEPLAEVPPAPLAPAHADLAALLDRLMDRFGSHYEGVERRLDDADWVAGRLAEFLPLPPNLKQAMLEMDRAEERLALIRDGLRQLGLAAGGSTAAQ